MSSGLLIVGGLVALIVGGDVLVRAGLGLASWLGIRPMMIGLTVVSLGTSVPELAIGIDAAVSGSPGLAVGNIVGTNLVFGRGRHRCRATRRRLRVERQGAWGK